jgi:hypothetical protein
MTTADRNAIEATLRQIFRNMDGNAAQEPITNGGIRATEGHCSFPM